MATEKRWRCEGGCNEYVTILRIGMEGWPEDILIVEMGEKADSIWDRVKTAARVLWYGSSPTGEITLDAENAREIADALSKVEAKRDD